MVCLPCGRNPDLDGKSIMGWAITHDVGLHWRENDFVVSRCIGPTIGVWFGEEWNERNNASAYTDLHRDLRTIDEQVSGCLCYLSKALTNLLSTKKGSNSHEWTGIC